MAQKLVLNIIKPDLTDAIDQTWSLKKITEECVPASWEKVFEESEHEFKAISDILDKQEGMYGSYYPLKKDIFKAFRITKLSDIKVVIIGQDPYHQAAQINGKIVPRAQGLAFSVDKDDSIPSSLMNIYKELEKSVHGFIKPDHGDLTEWSQREGVFLLNSCLTVRANEAGSHGAIWTGFIYRVLRAIAAVNPTCIFLLWGREAQNVQSMVGEKSVVLCAPHPSGLSANRGFFGCNHFNLANEALKKQNKSGINWKLSSKYKLEDTKIVLNVQNNAPNTQTNNSTFLVKSQFLSKADIPIIPNIPNISNTTGLIIELSDNPLKSEVVNIKTIK